MKHFCFLTFFLLLTASCAYSLEVGGVKLPETLEVDGVELVLNGSGLRTKTFLKIKVYAGGLYLTRRSSEPVQIINADEPMAVRMVFIRDGVSPEQLVSDWVSGFETVTHNDLSLIKDQMEQFNLFFNEEARRGDVYDLAYIPGEGVKVYIKGKLKGTVNGLFFKKALFGIWLGDDPCDSGLKEGMLGK